MPDGATIDADVVVIGAGPTGLTTAALLADYGVRVAVIERHPSTGDEPRAISITDESLRILQQLGVRDSAAAEMLLDTGARYFGRNGQLIAEVRPASSRLGQPGKSQFDQPDVEARLAGAVAARPNARLMFGTEVTAIADGPDGVSLTVQGPGGEASVSARWLIACDGGRSFTRAALGIELEGSTQVEKWVVVDLLNVPSAPEHFAEFHCNGSRPVVVVPGVGGRCRYEFMLLPGDDERAIIAPESIVELVAPFRRIVAADIRRAAVYVAHQRIAERYRSGHVLLAGDAAHLMPPFAGQGLNAGLRDAANLAWKVAAVVQGTGTDALIDSYEIERRPHARDMVRLSHRIGQVVMSTNPAMNLVRDATVKAVGIVPAWKRWLTGMRFLKQPHFTSGCVVTPGAGVPSAVRDLVGRAISQPVVTSASGVRLLLDEVLGDGWAVLRPSAAGDLELTTADSTGQRRVEHVVDPARTFAAAEGLRLVVRPDRYLAAAFAPADARAVARELGRYSTVAAELLEDLARTPPTPAKRGA